MENKTGIPFVGTAGRILHHLFKMVHFQFEYIITNAVGCRPVDISFLDPDLETEWELPPTVVERNEALKEDKSFSLDNLILDQDYELFNWNREPTKAELTRCSQHIDEILEHYQPHGVIYLGKIAESYKDPKYLVPLDKLTELDSKHYQHTSSSNKDFVWRHVPTLSLLHPAYIARLEYKLLTARKQANKLNLFIEKFFQ